jgi:transposase
MDVIYPRCAGLDVHKKTVRVCLLLRQEQGKNHKEYRTYGTTTQELLDLLEWLLSQECSHVALEGTGVYWKPVFNLFEGHIQVLVVNAQHIKAVPGRKTDTKDAEWIADLLQHGLLKASFIPSAPQRELRELTRYRVRLSEERSREVNRVQKTLEGCNLKLGDVVSDVMGKASHMILSAIADGESDPARLASLAVGRVRASQEELEAALTGTVSAHHRFLLREHLTHIEQLDQSIERLTAEIARRLMPPDPPEESEVGKPNVRKETEVPKDGRKPTEAPEKGERSWEEAVRIAMSLPGIAERAATGILAEIGINMQQFPSDAHLASWVGICPGNHESAGKQLSGKTRKGNPWVRRLLLQAAQVVSRQKKGYLPALYRRIAARRGKKRAIMALAHRILVILYHLLRDGVLYEEKGEAFLEERDREMMEKRLVHQLERLGNQVTLQPLAQAG